MLLLTALVVHRLTRLLVRDQFPPIAWPRERLVLYWRPDMADESARTWYVRRHAEPPQPHWGGLGRSLAYLLTCDWCVSIYVAAGVVLVEWYWAGWFTHPLEAVLIGLAASTVTGLIAQREPD